jgi:hypothetical protein
MSNSILKQNYKPKKAMLKPNPTKVRTKRQPRDKELIKVNAVFKVVNGQLVPIETKVDFTDILSGKKKKSGGIWK